MNIYVNMSNKLCLLSQYFFTSMYLKSFYTNHWTTYIFYLEYKNSQDPAINTDFIQIF